MPRDTKTNAVFIAAAAGVFIAAPVGIQTQRDVGWCSSATLDPGLEIKGCTALIQSGRWPGRYVAFAYDERGGAYQGNGNFDRAISDYSEAIRLDSGYLFADYDRGSELRSAELRTRSGALKLGQQPATVEHCCQQAHMKVHKEDS